MKTVKVFFGIMFIIAGLFCGIVGIIKNIPAEFAGTVVMWAIAFLLLKKSKQKNNFDLQKVELQSDIPINHKSILLTKMSPYENKSYEITQQENTFFIEFEKEIINKGLNIDAFHLTRKYDGSISIDHVYCIVGNVNLRYDEKKEYSVTDYNGNKKRCDNIDGIISTIPYLIQSVKSNLIEEGVSSDKNVTYNETLDIIEKLNEENKKHLEELREKENAEIAKFDPAKVIVQPDSETVLTLQEQHFLKQMNGQKIKYPSVYAYWFYEYSINFSDIMTKLMVNGYLTICDTQAKVNSLKVDELKELLSKFNCIKTGKKADLIKRVFDEIDVNEINKYLSHFPDFYVLTNKGIEATANLAKLRN